MTEVALYATMPGMNSPFIRYLKRERGAQKALAEALGVDRVTLWRWARGTVPADKLIDVERATGIPRGDLRPDLYDFANTEFPGAA